MKKTQKKTRQEEDEMKNKRKDNMGKHKKRIG